MDWLTCFDSGLDYFGFLERYATVSHAERWNANYEANTLTVDQTRVIRQFKRHLKVLCLSGTWCGDCASQCPIFQRIVEAASPAIVEVRYIDRDAAPPHFAERLGINGGHRVPAVVFLSEEGYEVARYGEKTLAKYRSDAATLDGVACSLGIPTSEGNELRRAIISEWVDQFERAHLILRLSARLREKYAD